MAHSPCVLVSKTGPLRSITSKREPSYSNGDVPVCTCILPLFPLQPSETLLTLGQSVSMLLRLIVLHVGMSEYVSVPFKSIL